MNDTDFNNVLVTVDAHLKEARQGILRIIIQNNYVRYFTCDQCDALWDLIDDEDRVLILTRYELHVLTSARPTDSQENVFTDHTIYV